MNCSEAQLAANRQNALKSTGPTTEAGKQISRANAYKHGMAGDGVVVPAEDVEQIEDLADALELQLKPVGPMGRILVRRIAVQASRLDNMSFHETSCLVDRMSRAELDFDDAQAAEAEKLMAWIAAEPATNARRLRRTPEGVRTLLDAWQAVRDDLTEPNHEFWSYSHLQRVENLMGRRPEDLPNSRVKTLSEAICGRHQFLEPGEAADLDDAGRRLWAKGRMVELIDAEVAKLRLFEATEHDPEAHAARRAGARDRSRFDPSHEAQLARRYDAANERAMFRIIKELRETRLAQVDVPREPETPPQAPELPGDPAKLGSFRAEPPTEYERRRARPDPSTLRDRTRAQNRREVRDRPQSSPRGPA